MYGFGGYDTQVDYWKSIYGPKGIYTGEGYVSPEDWGEWFERYGADYKGRLPPGYKVPSGHAYGGASGGGSDWWDLDPATGIAPRTKYEEILESLRGRSIADPHQQATSFGADVLGGTGYDDLLQGLYSAIPGYMPTGVGKGTFGRQTPEQALGRLMQTAPADPGHTGNIGYLSNLMNQINQTKLARSGTFAGAAGGALGPATSMVQTGYRGLQGFRGQDQQRYLAEMQMEMQLKMLMAQIKAQAQQNQGGGLWDILGDILPLASMFIPGVGPWGGLLAGLFGSRDGESGGGMQYQPGFLGGG